MAKKQLDFIMLQPTEVATVPVKTALRRVRKGRRMSLREKRRLESKRKRARKLEEKRLSEQQNQSVIANIEKQLRLNIKEGLRGLNIDEQMVATRISKLAQISMTAAQSLYNVRVQKLQPVRNPIKTNEQPYDYIRADDGNWVQESVPLLYQSTAEAITSAENIFRELLRNDCLQGEIAKFLRGDGKGNGNGRASGNGNGNGGEV